jgi:hypothetical protein
MAGDPVPDRPHVHSNAYPWLKVPGSRECAHLGILGWNPPVVGYFVLANFADTPAFRTSGSDP